MNSHSARLRDLWRDPVAVASFVLTWGGFVLGSLRREFFALIAVGLFGPWLLRGLGLLKQDEFREEAARRAAEIALATTGVFLVGVLAANGMGGTYSQSVKITYDAIPASLPLVILALSYQIASLMRFWGVRIAASRIFFSLGIVWILLTVAVVFLEKASMSAEDIAVFALIALFFMGLAVLSLRRPRIAGGVALLLSILLIWMTGFMEAQTKSLPWDWFAFEAVLTAVPFAVPAFALLFERPEPDDCEDLLDSLCDT
jgi:hypothetical protein